MKQFNRIILGIAVFWVLLGTVAAFWIQQSNDEADHKVYLVEINRIQDIFLRQGNYSEIDLTGYHYVKAVDYLPVNPVNQGGVPGEQTPDGNNPGDAPFGNEEDNLPKEVPVKESPIIELQAAAGIDDAAIEQQEAEVQNITAKDIIDFFEGKELSSHQIKAVPQGYSYRINPLITEEGLMGYLRYSYQEETGDEVIKLLALMETLIGIMFLLVIGVMLYIRNTIIAPFHEISELPYELSKGHLPKEVKETKNRYFGRFIWGLNLLRENLEAHKKKELQLEKDKKLMILSISHDIKTPLSTIKLYSKALYEDLYTSEEKKHETAKKIEEKADQIEQFVTEIIKTSSTDLFDYEVITDDFYLSKLIEAVRRTYEEKLELLKIKFLVGSYLDKLLKGDVEKLIDVFDNLFQNAIKYGDGRQITLSFEEEDNCQLIRITNTGLPIPSTQLHHMFDSFWRGENAVDRPGNGLGLYICRQLMHKMDGEIYSEASDDSMSFVVVIKKS